MSIEKFKLPEQEQENLSEKQKEILELIGITSIKELEEINDEIEENLKQTEKNSKEYQELLEQKAYFSGALGDIKEVNK